MRMKITNAGRARLVSSGHTGTNAVLVASIGLSETPFTPTADLESLPGEFKRMDSFGGQCVAADTIHVTLQDSSTDRYSLFGYGLFLDDGTLFATYGQNEAIMEKASVSTLLLSADTVFADIDATQIVFGSTEFLNPPATTEVLGVVELATDEETATGVDAIRAVTPRGLRSTLDDRLGPASPTSFAKELLALAAPEQVRGALHVKAAALKDMGHGNGLDADTLDGRHASEFPQVGEVQPALAVPDNSAQARWIRLCTLGWAKSSASIFMAELSNGAIGARRYSMDLVTASTRGYSSSNTALTQRDVDNILGHLRHGLKDTVQSPMQVGLTLNVDDHGVSTGVDLWLKQPAYQHGHRLRPINSTATAFHGVTDFLTAEPDGILYAAVAPVVYESELRKLVDASENNWGLKQNFLQGIALQNDKDILLGSGASIRGYDSGSIVIASSPAKEGRLFWRPNGRSSAAGQAVLNSDGQLEVAKLRIGPSPDRSFLFFGGNTVWSFAEGAGNSPLELRSTYDTREFHIVGPGARKIVITPSSGSITTDEFRGKLTGNADSATRLAAARTINGVAFDGSANIVTTSWGAQRKVTIGSAARQVNGASDLSWSLTEIGAASLAHKHSMDDILELTPTLARKGDWIGDIANGTYDDHLSRTSFCAAFHSKANAPEDAPTNAQYNVLHFGSTWGRAQIAVPNDQARMFFRGGTRSDWLEAWHSGNFNPASKAAQIPGQVILFAGARAPGGTLLCNGAAVARTTYAALFAAIGTLYGPGDGKTTFNLPSLFEGATVVHTRQSESVGTATGGALLRHNHDADTRSAGSHDHRINVGAGGRHSHSASSQAAGDHTHNTWTDGQGGHSHTVRDPGHNHTWMGPNRGGGGGGWAADGVAAPSHVGTSASGTGIWLDEAGVHGHNIGMNGPGNHAHSISVGDASDHGHSASSESAGSHTHTTTVNDAGGDRNLAAGLRMIYCITY